LSEFKVQLALSGITINLVGWKSSAIWTETNNTTASKERDIATGNVDQLEFAVSIIRIAISSKTIIVVFQETASSAISKSYRITSSSDESPISISSISSTSIYSSIWLGFDIASRGATGEEH